MARTLRLTLLCLLLAGVAARPQTTTTAPAPLDARLERIDAKSAAIRDLTATFVQEKRSPLLRDPLVTRGEVRALPSAMRWTSGGTTPTVLSVNADLLRIFYVDQKVVEEYPVRGNISAMTASPLPRLSALREAFRIETDDGTSLPAAPEGVETLALKLTPTAAEMADNVRQVRVLLDAGRGVVLAFETTDPDGEVTTVQFADIKTDVGLTGDDVRLDVPAGARTVRPLGGGGE